MNFSLEFSFVSFVLINIKYASRYRQAIFNTGFSIEFVMVKKPFFLRLIYIILCKKLPGRNMGFNFWFRSEEKYYGFLENTKCARINPSSYHPNRK